MRGVVPPVERPAVLAREQLRQEVMSILKPEVRLLSESKMIQGSPLMYALALPAVLEYTCHTYDCVHSLASGINCSP